MTRWLAVRTILLAALLGAALAGEAQAQGGVTARLEPVAGSTVSGTAVLTPQGQGTLVTLEAAGLAPGSEARVTLQAGTCAMPSTSFTGLPLLVADASGQARAAGPVLFRGAEDIALADIADGEHIIVVMGPGGMVACGVVPAPGSCPPHCEPPGDVTGGPPQTPIATDGVTSFRDVAYATKSPAEMLDLYVPGGAGPFPLVINIHGGAFKAGDKTMLGGASANPLLAAGYAVATINYRLTGEATFPAQIQDAKAAVRFLRANAANYNLDPGRFAAFGQSAGGNLAMLLGTSGGVAELEDASLGNADASSAVQAVISFFGPADFSQMDAQFEAAGTCPASAQSHDAADSPESLLVGGVLQTKLDVVKAANPITYVSKDDPPFFLQAGTSDCTVPPQQSQLMYDALAPVIGKDNVSLTLIEGAGHGDAKFDAADNMALVVAFLDKHLK